MILSSTTVFTGVPVGSAPLLSQGIYTPELTLANFSNTDVRVSIKYSRTSGEHAIVQDLTRVTVPFGTAKHLSFRGLDGDTDLKNSFLVTSDAAAGDMVAKLVATSQSKLHEVELLGKDAKDHVNGGVHPWSLEQGNESNVLLFNHSGQPQTFNLLIGSGKALWTTSYKLQPMVTMNISLRELIQGSVKDKQGRKLSARIRNGEVEWFIPNPSAGHGRLLQSNRVTVMARNFSCGQFYVICGVNFDQLMSNLAVGSTNEFAVLNVTTCSNPMTPTGCTGSPTSIEADGELFSWASANPSVAPISGSSFNPSVNIFGKAAGGAHISGGVSDRYSCGGSGGGTLIVGTCAIPINFRQTSESNLTDGTLHFVYQFDSSTGNTADLAGCTVGETVFYPGGQNPYVWPLPMVARTNNPDVHQSTGNNAFTPDNNSPPSSYQKPYAYAHFTATQRFWWICPCFQNGQLQTFVPDVTIDRKVFQDTDSIWKYQIQKSGYTNKVALP